MLCQDSSSNGFPQVGFLSPTEVNRNPLEEGKSDHRTEKYKHFSAFLYMKGQTGFHILNNSSLPISWRSHYEKNNKKRI